MSATTNSDPQLENIGGDTAETEHQFKMFTSKTQPTTKCCTPKLNITSTKYLCLHGRSRRPHQADVIVHADTDI